MDEDKIQQQRRDHEEQSTRERAAIIGLQYLDAREIENTLPLAEGVLDVKSMYQGKLVPLVAGDRDAVTQFAATAQTPNSLIQQMTREYNDGGKQIRFYIISGTGFRAFMRRYDPPREVKYDDIEIAREGDSETIQKVSQTLETVGTEAVFDFLISQADKLGASDIHIENSRDSIRIRMRVDGALHAVAELSRDRYRIIMGELARRANISTAAAEPFTSCWPTTAPRRPPN